MQIWLVCLYILMLIGMAFYGWLGLITLWLYWRNPRHAPMQPETAIEAWPPVTVQLPLYNEATVVQRLINAVAQLDYPADKLQIQVLDDSTDHTTELARERIAFYQQQGVNISLHHRENRQGYKAGALEEGMASAQGDYIAIFDADFCPQPNFLRQTLPPFLQNPRLGNVQTRWTYLNDRDSSLTTAEAIALDKQFATEKTVRSEARLFPKFNGSGGVWRRTCLEDAGGWHIDTLCEDLCISTRAVLKGWEFTYLYDVETPSELPTTIGAYKVQQGRWATGSVQCFLKYFRALINNQELRWFARIYALIAMGAHFTSAMFVGYLLLQVAILYYQIELPAYLAFFTIFAFGHPILLIWGQRTLHRADRRRSRHLFTTILLTIGLTPDQTVAVIKGVLGKWRGANYSFRRTPKGSQSQVVQMLHFDWRILIELLLAAYMLFGAWIAVQQRAFSTLGILLLAFAGFSYVIGLGVREQFVRRRTGR